MQQLTEDNSRAYSHTAGCSLSIPGARTTNGLTILAAFLSRAAHGCAVLALLLISTPAYSQPPKPEQPSKSATQPATAAKVEAPLPPNYKVPAKVADIMNIDKPLITAELALKMKREVIKKKASKLILNGQMGKTDRQIIKVWIELQILPMTMKENRDNLPKMRRQLAQQIASAARLVTSANQARTFRKFFLQEITTTTERLLDNNFDVRFTAVLILAHLDIVERSPRNSVAEPFIGTYIPFLKILKDEKQHTAVKIIAATGLRRILLYSKPDGNIRREIAKGLIAELEKPDNYLWYDWRLIQALSRVEVSKWIGAAGFSRPYVILTLENIINNKEKHWIVRAEAVRALGLIKPDLTVEKLNPNKLAADAVRFCDEMAIAYNKNPYQSYWGGTFYKTLLTFRPRTLEGLDRKDGLRTRNPQNKEISQAHDLVRTIFLHVKTEIEKLEFNSKLKQNEQNKRKKWAPIPQSELKKLTDWLKRSPGFKPVPTTAIPVKNGAAVKTAGR